MELFDPSSLDVCREPDARFRGGFPDTTLTDLEELRAAIQAEQAAATARELIALGRRMVAERRSRKPQGTPSGRDTESTGAADSVI